MPRVEFRDVGKRFGGTRALDGVSLTVESGECHALVGENGAGKSTLGRILAGIHPPDRGQLLLDGRPVRFRSPADARAAGVAMVHQELAFCPDLSVAENLLLGAWPVRGLLLDRRAMRALAQQRLAEIGVALDVTARLASLSTAQEQLVQIAAAVGTGAGLLIFDEPTSSLTPAEAERLFALIGRLRARGATILYVSHRLSEVEALADRISVLRDGRLVATLSRGQSSPEGLVRLMLGRDLARPDESARAAPRVEGAAPAPAPTPAGALLAVQGLASPGRFADVSLTLRAGEIVGLAGLVGAGRSELLRALFGLDPAARGRVLVAGAPLRPGSARRAIAAGLALVPEDRKRQGLVLSLGARPNWSLPVLRRLPRWGGAALAGLCLLDRGAERRAAAAALGGVGATPASLETPVSALSGGNQQKVVLARWLSTGARVLLVDEPTRGVDVGAKAQIHALLRRRAAEGAAVLLVSSELEELLALSDRILVMRQGRLVGELSRAEAGDEALLSRMVGVAS